MPRKITNILSPAEELAALEKAALETSGGGMTPAEDLPIEGVSQRIDKILGLLQDRNRKGTNMLFFVMYDIENNKVRKYIAKYLIRCGCHRVQKSIFLADLPPERYRQIRTDLTEVNSFYESDDSIIVVPISTDYLKAMSIIGKSIQMDVILKSKSTLFF